MRLPTSVRAVLCTALVTLFSISLTSFAATYSWQEPHARVLNNGDLQWAPKPFVFVSNGSDIYIDYEGGSDSNNGTSPTSAFKHHPWDANATGNAAATSGVHTYIFKRGVIYRGHLVAKEGGTPGNPIILTSDPSWGTGEAGIYGSERIAGGWTQCTAGDAPLIPDPTKVWYIDLPAQGITLVDNGYGSFPAGDTRVEKIYVQLLAEVTQNGLERVNIARSPNWTLSDPDYPLKDWWVVDMPDASHVKVPDWSSYTTQAAADWVGGTMWSTWGYGMGAQANMATVNQVLITNASGGAIGWQSDKYQTNPYNRFHVENLPQLLDSPNEFYYKPAAPFKGRLYLRLSGDRNPNTAVFEVGVRPDIIDIKNKSNITISGLTIACNNNPRPGTFSPECVHFGNQDGGCQAIELAEKCHNIEIANNKFRHVIMGIAPTREELVNPSQYNNIIIRDNDFAYTEDCAINISKMGKNRENTLRNNKMPSIAKGYIKNIKILRNKIYENGFRSVVREYSAIPAINMALATSGEIAGNFIDRSWGQGINYRGEVGYATNTENQVKILVHHNKVTTTLLATNDWGGIEGWYDGPCYVFNNISYNPRGYRPFENAKSGTLNSEYNPWGFAIYIDHGQHHKVFNNIMIGKENSTSDAYNRNAAGFMQAVSHYSFFANNSIFKFFKGTSNVGGEEGTYVGNLYEEITYRFETEANSAGHTAYAKNVYSGNPIKFAKSASSLSAFQGSLSSSWVNTVGIHSSGKVMVNASAGDFRPTGDAIGSGTRIFVPWNLPNVVGEWGFQMNQSNPSVVYGYDGIVYGSSNQDLSLSGASAGSYINGPLEDWTKGALQFDGLTTHGTVSNNSRFDVGSGSFILEAYVRTSSGGSVMSKGTAYDLSVLSGGALQLKCNSYTLTSATSVKDGAWHHVLAEVDRGSGKANLYIDGALSNGASNGSLPSNLSNSSSFYVGRGSGGFFKGDIDFARVAKGSFADGATSYDELFQWQFHGPATKDFAGQEVIGARDAGALQFNQIGIGNNGLVYAATANRLMNVRYLPGVNRVLVNFTALESNVPISFRVMNLAGRTLFSEQTNSKKLGAASQAQINTAQWAHGVYLLHIKTPQASKVFRIMKHL